MNGPEMHAKRKGCAEFALQMQAAVLVAAAPFPSPGLNQRLRSITEKIEIARPADWISWVRPSPSEVLCLHESVISHADWPVLRVRLAETGRFFVVLLESHSSGQIVRALRDGAYEVIRLDDPPERWSQALAATAEAERLWTQLYGLNNAGTAEPWLSGVSPAMKQLRETIHRIGPTQASVLIMGESGTGKERVAQALHAASAGHGAFVAINCAAIPRDLLEAELFGTTKGAFTGANADRPGLVEQANGGTLFLDEVGEMDLSLQPKLLRFLETRRARRVGARSEYAVNVRIVAATNADLQQKMARGVFREDLYYRLAEFTLSVSPLRQRREDIPVLIRQFLEEAGVRHDKVITGIEPALLQKLQSWEWPGNARELRSAVERMVILANGTVLGTGAWDQPVPNATAASPASANHPPAPPPSLLHPSRLSRLQKRELAFQLLRENRGDQAWVAAQLSIHPTTLYRWRKQAGVE